MPLKSGQGSIGYPWGAFLADIFISYSHVDRDEAERLAYFLEQSGFRVWWDREVRTGQIFEDVIEKQISKAKAVVVLWSETSVDARWVRAEAAEAADRGVLFPVLLDRITLPLQFRSIQASDLSVWNGEHDDPNALRLVAGIEAFIHPSQADPTGTWAVSPNQRQSVGSDEAQGMSPIRTTGSVQPAPARVSVTGGFADALTSGVDKLKWVFGALISRLHVPRRRIELPERPPRGAIVIGLSLIVAAAVGIFIFKNPSRQDQTVPSAIASTASTTTSAIASSDPDSASPPLERPHSPEKRPVSQAPPAQPAASVAAAPAIPSVRIVAFDSHERMRRKGLFAQAAGYNVRVDVTPGRPGEITQIDEIVEVRQDGTRLFRETVVSEKRPAGQYASRHRVDATKSLEPGRYQATLLIVADGHRLAERSWKLEVR